MWEVYTSREPCKADGSRIRVADCLSPEFLLPWEFTTEEPDYPSSKSLSKGQTNVSSSQGYNTSVYSRKRPDGSEQENDLVSEELAALWRSLAERCWSKNPQQRPDFQEIITCIEGMIETHRQSRSQRHESFDRYFN